MKETQRVKLVIECIEPNEYFISYENDGCEPLWAFSTDDACREMAAIQFDNYRRMVEMINNLYLQRTIKL